MCFSARAGDLKSFSEEDLKEKTEPSPVARNTESDDDFEDFYDWLEQTFNSAHYAHCRLNPLQFIINISLHPSLYHTEYKMLPSKNIVQSKNIILADS